MDSAAVPPTVVGIDACTAGWVAVVLRGAAATGMFGATLRDIAVQVPDAQGFGVDIPIGVPASGERRADLAAPGPGAAALVAVHDTGA